MIESKYIKNREEKEDHGNHKGNFLEKEKKEEYVASIELLFVVVVAAAAGRKERRKEGKDGCREGGRFGWRDHVHVGVLRVDPGRLDFHRLLCPQHRGPPPNPPRHHLPRLPPRLRLRLHQQRHGRSQLQSYRERVLLCRRNR